MGGVVSVIAPFIPVIVDLIKTLTHKPEKPAQFQVPAGKTQEQMIREAQAALGIDPVNHYNFAICGPAGVGKSSLINALRGLRPGDAGAAAVGVVETTHEIKRYDHPVFPYLKLWDIPGAGTQKHPVDTYFDDKKLYAFDAVLVVNAGRLLEVAPQIAEGGKRFGKPVAFVWSKADVDVDSLCFDRGLAPDAAVAQLRRDVERSFQENVGAKYGGMHRVFLISVRDYQRGISRLDENALVAFLEESARLRG